MRTTRTVETEENILEIVEEEPSTCTCRLERKLRVPITIVNKVLKLLHPYDVQKVQEFLPTDPFMRLTFCQFIRNKRIRDPNFFRKILFTDEACFKRSGVTNLHNEHIYSDKNPHAIKVAHHQHQFKLNIWAGIIDRYLIGPVVISDRLDENIYLNFLQHALPIHLENLVLLLRREMWYMHDGDRLHFSVAVRRYLHHQYPNRWIGRDNDAPVK